MEKSIRVRVLGRDYALRVSEEDEAATREMVAYVDTKMRAFHRAFPDQPELTTAVIAALAIAEEYFALRDQRDRQQADVEDALVRMEKRLAGALGGD
jgi:cell division protein ZapA